MASVATADLREGWQRGWWDGARHCPSPNFGPRPTGTLPTLAVVHSISLPPGVYGGAQVEQFFLNQLDVSAHPYFDRLRGLRVSAHFFIRREGECVQFVSCLERAWHAGASVWRGRSNCNDFSIGIELEGLEGEAFEAAQYARLHELLVAIAGPGGCIDVAGHEHVATGRKCDPGCGFQWARTVSALGWPARCFPEDVIAAL